MTEAVTAVLEWAFRSLPELTSVRSGGLAANLGSMRVMQKCGLVLESRETLEFAKFGGAKCEVLNHGFHAMPGSSDIHKLCKCAYVFKLTPYRRSTSFQLSRKINYP